jgi:hypothetical protein
MRASWGRLQLGIGLLVLGAGCGPEASEPVGTAESKLVTIHDMGFDSVSLGITTDNAHGNVATLSIAEGDVVNFHGMYTAATNVWSPMARTDTFIQIADPSLFPASDPCEIADHDVAHRYDALDKNELTGPMRRGVSGIFALGAEDAGEGYYEPAPGAACSTLPRPPGAPLTDVFVSVETAVDPLGVTHRLCRLVDTIAGTPSSYGTNLLLESTWDNPDITGAVIRINWRELQKYNSATDSIEFDWTRLDTELDRAAKRGKNIYLEVECGDGIPDWVFDSFDTVANPIVNGPLHAAQAVPVKLKDAGSHPSGAGWVRVNGSPNDSNYQYLVENLLYEVVNHLRSDSRWFQALGSLKVTGLNFMTGEMRLQKECRDDGSCPDCWCNTQIWAAPLGTNLSVNAVDPVHPLLNANNDQESRGGGYTEMGLYAFVNFIEHRIFEDTQGQKSLIYMIIQDGFPRVKTATDFWRDSTATGGPTNGSGVPKGTIQTERLLMMGRNGLFLTQMGNVPSNAVGKLFIAQHAGLQKLPWDQGFGYDCSQHTTPVYNVTTGKYEAPVPSAGSDGNPGCPNPWAIDESYLGQLSGFQTNNLSAIVTPDDLDSALWNGTVNTRMVFLEAYEQVLWRVAVEKGTGSLALAMSATNHYASMIDPAHPSAYTKNLHDWANELHARRSAEALAQPSQPGIAEPYPTVHSVTFDEPLNPGDTRTYYVINPTHCAAAVGPKYGTITVTGN